MTLDVEANDKMDRTVKKRLDPTVWMLASDAYALAAAATEQVTELCALIVSHNMCFWFVHQLPFNAAIRHKLHIAEIMTAATLEERSAYLGVIYDEVVRYFTRMLPSQCVAL